MLPDWVDFWRFLSSILSSVPLPVGCLSFTEAPSILHVFVHVTPSLDISSSKQKYCDVTWKSQFCPKPVSGGLLETMEILTWLFFVAFLYFFLSSEIRETKNWKTDASDFPFLRLLSAFFGAFMTLITLWKCQSVIMLLFIIAILRYWSTVLIFIFNMSYLCICIFFPLPTFFWNFRVSDVIFPFFPYFLKQSLTIVQKNR